MCVVIVPHVAFVVYWIWLFVASVCNTWEGNTGGLAVCCPSAHVYIRRILQCLWLRFVIDFNSLSCMLLCAVLVYTALIAYMQPVVATTLSWGPTGLCSGLWLEATSPLECLDQQMDGLALGSLTLLVWTRWALSWSTLYTAPFPYFTQYVYSAIQLSVFVGLYEMCNKVFCADIRFFATLFILWCSPPISALW